MYLNFRTYCEFYSAIISISPYQDLSLAQFVFVPAWPLMKLLNYAFIVPWLPQPQLYSFQVKAEIEIQRRRLVDEFIRALEYIEFSCPIIRQFPNSLLETAIKRITLHQQDVARRIHESHYVRQYLFKSEKVKTLESYEALAKGIRRRLLEVRAVGETYESHFESIRRHMHRVRQSVDDKLLSEYSPRGELTAQEAFAPYIQDIPFLQRSSSASNGSGALNITPHLYSFLYDISGLDSIPIPALRSAIAKLCGNSDHVQIHSGHLYGICEAYTIGATMSVFDDYTPGGSRRSWVVEYLETKRRHRYTESRSNEEGSIIPILESYKKFKNGAPLSEFL